MFSRVTPKSTTNNLAAQRSTTTACQSQVLPAIAVHPGRTPGYLLHNAAVLFPNSSHPSMVRANGGWTHPSAVWSPLPVIPATPAAGQQTRIISGCHSVSQLPAASVAAMAAVARRRDPIPSFAKATRAVGNDAAAGNVGFTPEDLPLPCAFVKLPWPPEARAARLLPAAPRTEAEKNSAYRLVLKRMFVEKLADSPAVHVVRYCNIPQTAIEQLWTNRNRSWRKSAGGPTPKSILHAGRLIFDASHTLGLGFHGRSGWILDCITSSGGFPVCVTYIRVNLSDLPFDFAAFQADWATHRKRLENQPPESHIVVVYDYRFDNASLWDSNCMRKIVHLTAVTQSIVDGWLITTLQGRSLQIVHLPPTAFSTVLEIARQRQLSILSCGERDSVIGADRCVEAGGRSQGSSGPQKVTSKSAASAYVPQTGNRVSDSRHPPPLDSEAPNNNRSFLQSCCEAETARGTAATPMRSLNGSKDFAEPSAEARARPFAGNTNSPELPWERFRIPSLQSTEESSSITESDLSVTVSADTTSEAGRARQRGHCGGGDRQETTESDTASFANFSTAASMLRPPFHSGAAVGGGHEMERLQTADFGGVVEVQVSKKGRLEKFKVTTPASVDESRSKRVDCDAQDEYGCEPRKGGELAADNENSNVARQPRRRSLMDKVAYRKPSGHDAEDRDRYDSEINATKTEGCSFAEEEQSSPARDTALWSAAARFCACVPDTVESEDGLPLPPLQHSAPKLSTVAAASLWIAASEGERQCGIDSASASGSGVQLSAGQLDPSASRPPKFEARSFFVFSSEPSATAPESVADQLQAAALSKPSYVAAPSAARDASTQTIIQGLPDHDRWRCTTAPASVAVSAADAGCHFPPRPFRSPPSPQLPPTFRVTSRHNVSTPALMTPMATPRTAAGAPNSARLAPYDPEYAPPTTFVSMSGSSDPPSQPTEVLIRAERLHSASSTIRDPVRSAFTSRTPLPPTAAAFPPFVPFVTPFRNPPLDGPTTREDIFDSRRFTFCASSSPCLPLLTSLTPTTTAQSGECRAIKPDGLSTMLLPLASSSTLASEAPIKCTGKAFIQTYSPPASYTLAHHSHPLPPAARPSSFVGDASLSVSPLLYRHDVPPRRGPLAFFHSSSPSLALPSSACLPPPLSPPPSLQRINNSFRAPATTLFTRQPSTPAPAAATDIFAEKRVSSLSHSQNLSLGAAPPPTRTCCSTA